MGRNTIPQTRNAWKDRQHASGAAHFPVERNLRRLEWQLGLRPFGVELKRNLKNYWWAR
jgi:hypothetical protein